MKDSISNFLTRLMARPAFASLNRLIFFQSARNLGFYNHQEALSGEGWFLKSHRAEISSVIDVGAHHGLFYHECCRTLDSLQTYRGIEAHPSSFKALKPLESEDHRFLNFAASDKEREIELFDYAAGDGTTHASVYKDVFSNMYQTDDLVCHRVTGKPIDGLLAEGLIGPADLLKIDAEGHEFAILKGAATYLSTIKPQFVMLEYNEHAIMANYHISDLLELLPDYQFHRLLPSGMVPIERAFGLENKFFAYCNLVGIRRS